MNETPSVERSLLRLLRQWFDSSALRVDVEDPKSQRIDWARCIPFIGMHAGCLLVIRVGFSWTALGAAVFLYLARVLAITGFFHRYFSHRSYKTSRGFQLVMAVLGATAVQRGVLWWAGHHREHHACADQEGDPHSPRRRGFLWSHIGWIMTKANYMTPTHRVQDWVKFPELVFLSRFDAAVPIAFAASLYVAGSLLDRSAPSLGTSGAQMLVWGFFVSTVALYHATFTINSLSHMYGRRRYATNDDSRNNPILAVITLGEGWHNNHHHYPVSARQGFYWWEPDATYCFLKALSWLGLIRELRPVPQEVLTQGRAPRRGEEAGKAAT